MIKAVIFDCFGVLTIDPWLAFCDTLPNTVEIAKARELNKAFDRGLINKQEFQEGVKQITGQTPPDIDSVHGNQIVKNTQLLDYIRTLKPQFQIGLLSNISSDWITEELLSEEEQKLFNVMIFSHQVGMAKPDPRIFILACERLRVAPQEAVMVDDIAAYVEAAMAEGMQGLVYSDFKTLQSEMNELLNPDN